MNTLIKNGILVSQGGNFVCDLLIQNGKIAAIGENIIAQQAFVLDAAGKLVLPGGVDVHTHLDLQAGENRAVDDFYSGTIAAAYGGTTTIIDHIGFGAAGARLGSQINYYKTLATGKAVIDYSFHGVIQHIDKNALEDMTRLASEGVTSFKLYMTYDFMLSDACILAVLTHAKTLGVMIAVHCENDSIITALRNQYRLAGYKEPIYHAKSRPAQTEAEAIARVLQIASLAGDAYIYIVHLSTKAGLYEINKAKERGQQNIYVETCPQYLLLTEDRYNEPDALKYIMSPPLRTAEDNLALWQGLKNNEIDVVATDHCPFTYAQQKQQGKDDFTICPNGAPGIEERMQILYSEGVAKGRISLTQYINLTATNPAKIFGIFPKKGTLNIGSDGDVIVLNPATNKVLTSADIHGACDYSLFERFMVYGEIEQVITSGNVLRAANTCYFKAGNGDYLPRNTINCLQL